MYRIILTLAILISPAALADWTLDANNSHLSFVSVKNAQVAEPHTFTSLEGQVTENGEASVTIMLDSVETMVPIRNQRMKEMLFETGVYPKATFKTKVPVERITALKAGEATSLDLTGSLSVHGNKANLDVPVTVTRTASDAYVVNTIKPVIVSANQFALTAGIEKLREVAGLESIATSVPVSFSLQFEKKTN